MQAIYTIGSGRIFSVRNSRARIAICFLKLSWLLLKLNLSGKFHAEVTTHLLHINLRTLYTLYIIIRIAT